MRVSFCTGIRTLPSDPAPLPLLYRDFLELGELAEELGFYRVWLSEHHFAEDDWNPSPLLVLSALATRTKRVRIGTYVTLIAMHNPLRMAEDTATLDILCDGRFDLGFGAGGSALEYETFGIDPKESFARAYEALDVVRKCWLEEEFSHAGKYYTFNNVRLRPKPVQRPIPIYAAAMGPQSQAKSAERGYHLVSALHSPTWRNFEGLLAENGRRREDADIVSGPIFCHISDNKEKAWDECEVGMQWALDFYARRGQPMEVPPVGEFRNQGTAYRQPIPVGAPEDVMKVLRTYKDEPMDEICLQFGFPGMPQSQAKRAMERFAKECMPEISTWGRQP